MIKKTTIILFILFIIILLGSFFNQRKEVSASNPHRPDLGENRIHLPLISTGVQSQFWIEISSLSDVTPQDGLPLVSGDFDAERLNYIESIFPTLISALKDSGAGGTRIYLSWSDLEPNEPVDGKPQYSSYWWKWYDARLREISKTGIDILIVVADTPDWATATCGPIYENRLNEFTRFLTDLVNRYMLPPYNVNHWELINEPDYTWLDGGYGHGCWGNHGAEYAKMLSLGYPAIKAVDPTAFVLQGGIAYDWFTEYGGPFNRYFPDDVMKNGGSNFIDALNFHYFTDFRLEWERWNQLPPPTCGNVSDGQGTNYEAGGVDIIAKASHYRNRMFTCFGVDKPIWVTELATHGNPDDPSDLAEQARYLIKGNVRGLAAGITNIIWYSLITNDSHNQGLLFDNLEPKPAFNAFQTLVRELRGFDYQQTIANNSVEAYVFKSPGSGREKVVAWGRGKLTFESASRLRVVDRNGNITDIEDGGLGDYDGKRNNVIVYKVSHEPSFIQSY